MINCFSILLQTLQNMISDLADALIYIPQGIVSGIILVILILAWCGFRKRPHPSAFRLTVMFFACVYAVVYAYLTFFSREPGSRTGRDWQLMVTWGKNWIPNAYFIENILLFIPFGILLPLGLQQFQNLRFCVAAGAVVSIMTETIQLITQRGHCQVDDVMTNVLGTVIGWTVYRWIRKRSYV